MLSDSEKRFQYYEGAIVKQHVFDPTKPDPLNYFAFHQRAMNLSDYDFSPTIMHYSSNLGAQTLHLLGYEFISDLEIEIGAYFTVVTDHRDAVQGEFAKLFGLDVSDIANHPHCLIGPVDELVEKIQQRREELGINYLTFGGAVIDDVAPIIDALSGS